MKRFNRREFGEKIERLAESWLLARGTYRSLGRNYYSRVGEIDLILEETRAPGNVELVFVEVRARSPGSLATGVESVDFRKRARLRRVIRRYLVGYRGGASGVRADILSWDGKEWEHYQNVNLEG